MKAFIPDHSWNEELKEIVRHSPMPGFVDISYCREPDFFKSLDLQGGHNDVIAVENKGELAFVTIRTIKEMYINNGIRSFGYMSTVRAKDKYKGSAALAVGYNLFRKLHRDGKTRGYLLSFVKDNIEAMRILTKKRKRFPSFFDLGEFKTYSVVLPRKKRSFTPKIVIKRGSEIPLAKIVDFLNTEGRKRQFFPVYTEFQFQYQFHGFNTDDFYIAMKDDEIIGVLGCWDQKVCKQNIVIKYNGLFQAVKPAVDLFLKVAGYQPLPAPGSLLGNFYISFVCIGDDDLAVFKELIACVFHEYSGTNYHSFVIAFHENDPLKEVMNSYFKFTYESSIYYLSWKEDISFFESLEKERIPYLEVATL